MGRGGGAGGSIHGGVGTSFNGTNLDGLGRAAKAEGILFP